MTAANRYYIGIDVGTQSVRGGLITSKGELIKSASFPIKTWNSSIDFYEQSSEDIWSLCVQVTKKISEGIDKASIRGIGFDATCSLVALDKNLKPLSVCRSGEAKKNIILWMDHRAVEEADFITSLAHPVLKFVGGKMSPEMEPPKLLWLKKNLPHQWEKAGYFFDLPDFLTWKATCSFQRSLCSLVCKWTYVAAAAETLGWQDDFWKEIGLADFIENNYEKIGSSVLTPGEPCGQGLSEEAALELGLLVNTPVSASIIDAHAGGLGVLGCSSNDNVSDNIEERMALICGTSTCHMKVNRNLLFTPGVWGPYYSAMVPDYWCSEAGQSAAGALLDHIVNSHPASAELEKLIGSRKEYRHTTDFLNEYVLELSQKQNLPSLSMLTSDIHVWPDYHGNRSPLADPDMKGMICGLTLSSSLEELGKQYLATVQALAYSTRQIISALESSGHSIQTLLVCGGLAKNPLYVQLHADITGLPVLIPDASEPVILGSAILGASAAKDFPSVFASMKAMCGSSKLVTPRTEDKKYHDKKYEVFLKLLECQRSAQKIMQSGKVTF